MQKLAQIELSNKNNRKTLQDFRLFAYF